MYKRWGKRIVDVAVTIIGLFFLWPIMLVIAFIVRVKLGRPIIFKQFRVGKNEENFILYKFRSMTNKCDEHGVLLSDTERLTTFGNFLRLSSLDELPELINILKGDMSLVGPRPLLCRYLPYYTEKEKQRHEVRPGLTGLAQVSGRNFLDWDSRLELDVKYVNSYSFLGDMKILMKTIGQVVKKNDIAVDTSKVLKDLDELRKEG